MIMHLRSAIPATACATSALAVTGLVLPSASAICSSADQPSRSSTLRCDEFRRPFRFNRDWDSRHRTDESIALQGRTRIILLIRHGQYETRGGPGVGYLTAEGRKQAQMTGQHIVDRMRTNSNFKKAMLKLTSSAMEHAIETGDIIEREIVEELSWVDVMVSELPYHTVLEFKSEINDEYAEFKVKSIPRPARISDEDNLLQPHVEIIKGSLVRLRVKDLGLDWRSSVVVADLLAFGDVTISVRQPLVSAQRLDDRFNGWKCAGCERMNCFCCVHWSDEAEHNGLGFCTDCIEAGTNELLAKMRLGGDQFSRISEGVQRSPFRTPHDKNLNEADADICSMLMPDDPLYKDYGKMNSTILKEHAQVNAAFYTHMHRAVNHKTIQRKERTDTIKFAFASAEGEKRALSLTPAEFRKLELNDAGQYKWLFDEDVQARVPGHFSLQTIGDDLVTDFTASEINDLVDEEEENLKATRPGKQVEILVTHHNVIRFIFLKAMQLDTTAWLNLGGSNCTMTQLSITRTGEVVCDFFGDHGSKMPVSSYTYDNKSVQATAHAVGSHLSGTTPNSNQSTAARWLRFFSKGAIFNDRANPPSKDAP